MNEKQAELTSALLDGELGREDQERTVSALLAAGPQELERFGRYRLIGDVMRGESAVLATAVAGQVSRSLQDEPVVLSPRPRPQETPGWLRPAAGLAVAASVAAAAVMVAPHWMTRDSEPGQPVQIAAGPLTPTVAPTLVAAGPAPEAVVRPDGAGATTRWHALDRGLEDRLNRLVIEHNECGGRTGIHGPVPHIGFVSYDAR